MEEDTRPADARYLAAQIPRFRITPYQLEMLAIRINRQGAEAGEVLNYCLGLDIPDESIAAFLEATGELANVKDRLADELIADCWLVVARASAELAGLRPLPNPSTNRATRRTSHGRMDQATRS